ncbi:CBS domain-containing protein [Stieleria varia]|uniref:Putative voltage-gated ClC-type chloride channel ClcB n=1 Tax=Stieleria varia TaxID=2528005 RepID=A0A5C6B317_9BACT|nr:CBS domain-containing protein [Stieleria varia]TWU06338.1 putative voltage-gated ClC-type chloride channel ClcB [Stieleria varia]
MSREEWTVADIMQAGVKTVAPDVSLPDLEAMFLKDQISSYPVIDEGRLVGVVSRSDIVRQICQEREVAQSVSDFHFDETSFYEVPMESLTQVADRIGERIESLTVADVMNKRPLTIGLDTPIRDVAQQFIARQVHRFPVTDQGTLVGIVSTTDLVRLIAQGVLDRTAR